MSKLAKPGEITDSGDPWENLANAVIARAANDYLASSEKRSREGVKLDEVIQFFHSDWFGILTQVDPDYLLEQLDKEKRLRALEVSKKRNE